MLKNAYFFFLKKAVKSPQRQVIRPKTPLASSGWGLRPKTPALLLSLIDISSLVCPWARHLTGLPLPLSG